MVNIIFILTLDIHIREFTYIQIAFMKRTSVYILHYEAVMM